MAIPAGTNCWTSTEDWFANTLPELASFRSLCGVTTEEAASERVYWDEVDEPSQDDPTGDADGRSSRGVVACVSSTPEGPYRRELGEDGLFWPSGTVLVYIEVPVEEFRRYQEITESANRGRIYREVKNAVGDVLGELTEYAYENGGPHIRDNYIAAFGENDEGDWNTEGRLVVAVLAVDWGMPQS